MRKTEAGLYAVEIDEHTYEFSKWGADESLDVLLDIASIAGGPLGQALAAFMDKGDGSILDSEVRPEMLGLAMEALTKSLRKEVVKPLIKKLSSENVLCDGKKVNFNLHYQDRLDHLFRVVKAALEVQYGNFFAAVRGLVGPGLRPVVTNRA